MSSSPNPETFFFKDHFKAKSTAQEYDQTTGGVTLSITKRILDKYLTDHDDENKQQGTFDGKCVLDNACGTGVVTREILRRVGGKGGEGVRIEAADISEAMVGYLRDVVDDVGSDLMGSSRVGCSVMDAQVTSPGPLHLWNLFPGNICSPNLLAMLFAFSVAVI
jgi:SAM-dependent methyltransferase